MNLKMKKRSKRVRLVRDERLALNKFLIKKVLIANGLKIDA